MEATLTPKSRRPAGAFVSSTRVPLPVVRTGLVEAVPHAWVKTDLPRLVVAGLAGDGGKSLVSLGLIGAARQRGIAVAPFKKGPDYIDAAWLGAAAACPARNLDTFLMPSEIVGQSLHTAAADAELAVIEGNRGLFDGLDAEGTHSTAQLAKLLGAPVLLVVDTTKSTRTTAAMVLGCQKLDPQLQLAGVILNRVGTLRQEKLIRRAIHSATGLPVLGVIPRLGAQHLPSRHLGLVTAFEHGRTAEVLESLAAVADRHLDVEAILDLARAAAPLHHRGTEYSDSGGQTLVRIGVLWDRAFSFYYPENLGRLQEEGAELVPISPIADAELPAIDALYAGGGFPEEYAAELSANTSLRTQLRKQIAAGLPVWAECGGLMYLSQALVRGDETHPMVGALPIQVRQEARPQGHGYVRARVDGANPFLPMGTELRGHEFHYSRLLGDGAHLRTALALDRGKGLDAHRDGLVAGEVMASYTHLHALGTPDWADGIVRAATGARS